MAVHVSSYEGGIDRDSSKNKYPKGSYYKMKNFRLISFDELSNGAVTSIKGNKSITILDTHTVLFPDDIIIGSIVIRNYLVVWSTNNHTTGGRGSIYKTNLSETSPHWDRIYTSTSMNLTTKYPIYNEVIGYYEDSNTIKVYWTDNYNMIRFINIMGTGPTTVDGLNILPNTNFVTPTIINIGGGNIYVGKVQYAFQYYNIGGIETTFSPCTPLIHLTQSSEGLTGSNIRLYEGSEPLNSSGNPNNSGKSVTIQISGIDTSYDMIRVVSILYRNLDQTPDISVVGEYEVIDNIMITDYGVYSKGTITLNAFRTLGNSELYCKTITQKGNKALIGNITEKFFDIDFDARAYRNSVKATTKSSNQTVNITSLTNLVNTSTNKTLYFTYPTPAAIKALYNDKMGSTAVTSHLKMEYTETGPYTVNSSEIGTSFLSGSIVPTRSTDNTIQLVIADFPTFVSLGAGKTITGVTIITSNNNSTDIVMGNWHDSSHTPTAFGSTKAESTITVQSYVGTTLTFTISTGGTNYFGVGFDHVDTDTGGTSQLVFTYQYTETLNYIYETTTNANLIYVRGTTSYNPDPWLWNISRTGGGNYISCVNPFSFACITSIHLDISISYTYWGIDPIITVYDSKTNTEKDIVQTGVWPNATFEYTGGVTIGDEDDLINPYNYDFLYGAALAVPMVTPCIDEIATYCVQNDFSTNVLTNEPTNKNCFKWQSDLVTLGGEGPNIKYEFVTTEMIFEKTSDQRYNQPDIVTINSLSSYDSYKNPLRTAYLMNNKRDEVYRYGLILTNNRGQDSFVKWIGDIKIPTLSESLLCTYNVDTTTSIFSLGIKFTVNTSSLFSQDVVSIKIVRVERKKEDRTIYTQGIISNMYLDQSSDAGDPYDDMILGFPKVTVKTPSTGTDALYTKLTNVVQFISPEINYFKELSPTSSHYIKTVAKFGCIYYGSTVFKYVSTTALTSLLHYHILDGTIAGVVEYGGEEDNKIIFPSSSVPLLNRSVDFDFGLPNHEGPSGTCVILVISSGLNITELISAQEDETFLVDYKIPYIAASQYGGLTYEARQFNTYIECGNQLLITGGTDDVLTVYGGDTFIDIHEHLKTIWEVDDNDGDTVVDIASAKRGFNITSFICESVINLGLSHGYKYSEYYINPLSIGMREIAGTYNADLTDHAMPNNDYDLIQDKNMYEYNSVYSQQNISKIHFAKPLNWLSIVHDDTVVKISLEKVAREEVDSFVKFLSDNKKTLPTQYGPINDLFLFKNYVIVFMDHAFGSLSVDERAILPVQNNSLLELGSADNLKYFDFISNSSGSIHPTSINKIGDGFGWFDAYLNSFGYYNGQTQDLGLVKGISSDIKTYCDNIKNPSTGLYYTNQFYGGNFLTYENKKYKESICAMIVSELADWDSNTATSSVFILSYSTPSCHNTVVVINGIEYYADIVSLLGTGILTINTTDNPSLIPALYSAGKYFIFYKDLSRIFTFNSVLNMFQHEVEINPQHLIEYNDDLFEIVYNKVFYQLNEGNYGEFYGIYRKGEIEYIINPQRSYVCIFNNYEYAMEAIASDGTNTVDETWSSLNISNDYQYSIGLPIDTTFTHATNKFTTIVSHGLKIDDELMLSGTIPTGFDSTIIYYVIEITTFTFRLSTSKGGTAEVLTNTGTCYYNLLDAPLIINTFSTTGNIMRRMRTWRIKDLRDRNSTKPRIRDTYVRLLFKYQHGSNKRIIMHDLYIYYSLSRESMGE